MKILNVSPDFNAKIMGLSYRAVQRSVLHTGKDIFNMIEYKKEHPIIRLDSNERAAFEHYYDLVLLHTQSLNYPFKQEVMASLFQALFCESCAVVARRMQPAAAKPHGMRRVDWIFKNFLRVLTESGGRERSVSALAQQLNVTPKYLSTVVKVVSGRTALDWIHEYTAEIVMHELRYTDKSIKEIAYALNFPSLSFFGKFCKLRLGMSPKAYRHQAGSTVGDPNDAAGL